MRVVAGVRSILVVAILVLTAACAGLGGLPGEPPRVTLADIGIEEIGLLEQKLRLTLRVQNPNDVAIGIQGLSYELAINGQHFAQGVSDRALRVPRYGEATLQVSAVTGLASVLRQWRDLRQGGREAIAYRVRGRLNLEGGGSVAFDHAGEIPLPALYGDGVNRL